MGTEAEKQVIELIRKLLTRLETENSENNKVEIAQAVYGLVLSLKYFIPF